MSDFKKVLIVDDSVTIVDIVKKLISSKLYEIITANNGLSGLKIARAEKPDVVLLDIMLPKMDGFTVCKNIKSDPVLAGTKVVMFSVKSDTESREKASENGADIFICKETGLSALAETIQSLIWKN